MRGNFIFFMLLSVVSVKAAMLPEHPELHAALNGYLQVRDGGADSKAVAATSYRSHLADLNGDGRQDALVLMLGRAWGGTGGQTMFIFKGGAEGFQFVSRMTCVSLPMPGSVCVTNERSEGWRDLAIRVSGGGAKAKFVRMCFDGQRYPLNPTVLAPMEDWPHGEFVLTSGDATAKALKAGRTHFTGLLGRSTRFQMGLKHQMGKVTGAYFYDKYGTPIPLEGEASGSAVSLREVSGGKVVATISLSHEDNRWIGAWKSTDGRKAFPLRLQLVATELKRHQTGRQGWNVRTAFPQFTGIAGGRFNAVVAAGFIRRFQESCDEFEKNSAELARDSKDTPQLAELSFGNWACDDSAVVCFFAPDLISIRGSTYEYTGGAHGNYGDFPMNYWWRNGTVTRVKVTDIFDAAKPWRTLLGRHLRRELIRKEAHYVVEGSVKEADLAKCENFTFSPAGAEFHFPPYEVGPYAQGAFRVTVPFKVLQPILRRDGPLARWAK